MALLYSEMFYSLQGEGRFVGVPSVFLRMFGCNFSCHGFGQPRDRSQWVSPEDMPYQTQSLDGVSSLEDLPVVKIGCDSSASWARRYRHLASRESVDVVAQRLVGLTPSRSWVAPSGQPVHLVITGGEPLLIGWQRLYPSLFEHPSMHTLQEVTFETNGTQPLRTDLQQRILDRGLTVTWSVSPKLQRSGERPAEAIRPDVLAGYAAVPNSFLYLKFVVHDREDVVEARSVIAQYQDAGVIPAAIYAMPAGGHAEQVACRREEIADACLAHGIRYSPRLHVDLFGNRFGT